MCGLGKQTHYSYYQSAPPVIDPREGGGGGPRGVGREGASSRLPPLRFRYLSPPFLLSIFGSMFQLASFNQSLRLTA